MIKKTMLGPIGLFQIEDFKNLENLVIETVNFTDTVVSFVRAENAIDKDKYDIFKQDLIIEIPRDLIDHEMTMLNINYGANVVSQWKHPEKETITKVRIDKATLYGAESLIEIYTQRFYIKIRYKNLKYRQSAYN